MSANSLFTKSERKEIRRLARLAYGFAYRKANHGPLACERELAKALEALENDFRQWRKNKITAFELEHLIHKFHNGVARDLWIFYESGDTELSARHAIAEGIILETEVSPGILEKLK